MIVVLMVAIFTVHLPNGFSSIKLIGYDSSGAHFGQPGYETDLLYLAGLLALSFGGAGPFSVDGFVKPRLAQGQDLKMAQSLKSAKQPGWRGAPRLNSPSPPPSGTRRAPPTANRR